MTSTQPKSVLFVCMGNICRSPAAEGVFRHLVAQAGREPEFHIDSAGTHGYHVGHPPDSRMRAAAADRGYLLDSTARRLSVEDFEDFDLIVVMDEDNFANVSAVDPGSGARVVRMCDYCGTEEASEVPDPYYGGSAGFERVLDILEDACTGLLRQG
jgi:protein-tyrosine phosphatase